MDDPDSLQEIAKLNESVQNINEQLFAIHREVEEENVQLKAVLKKLYRMQIVEQMDLIESVLTPAERQEALR